MPTWSEILTELKVESAQGNSAPFDFIRRKYLSELSKYTNRNIILYATAFTQKGGAPELLSVTEEDVQGMMEVSYGLEKACRFNYTQSGRFSRSSRRYCRIFACSIS